MRLAFFSNDFGPDGSGDGPAWIDQTPLRTGDIIATGTPEGVGMARSLPLWMIPGDEVAVEVSSVGSLRNPVSAEP